MSVRWFESSPFHHPRRYSHLSIDLRAAARGLLSGQGRAPAKCGITGIAGRPANPHIAILQLRIEAMRRPSPVVVIMALAMACGPAVTVNAAQQSQERGGQSQDPFERAEPRGFERRDMEAMDLRAEERRRQWQTEEAARAKAKKKSAPAPDPAPQPNGPDRAL